MKQYMTRAVVYLLLAVAASAILSWRFSMSSGGGAVLGLLLGALSQWAALIVTQNEDR